MTTKIEKMHTFTFPLNDQRLGYLSVPYPISRGDYIALCDWVALFGRTISRDQATEPDRGRDADYHECEQGEVTAEVKE